MSVADSLEATDGQSALTGWGGNAPPRFSDHASAREHLRACGAAQQHHQALKRFRRIGNRSAGGTADSTKIWTANARHSSDVVIHADPHPDRRYCVILIAATTYVLVQ